MNDEKISGVLLGLAVISVLQLSSGAVQDKMGLLALYAFAVSIPVNSLYVWAWATEVHLPSWSTPIFPVGGWILSVVGFGLLFFRFSFAHGYAFFASSLLLFAFWGVVSDRQKKSSNSKGDV
jgi:hypothetical protein